MAPKNAAAKNAKARRAPAKNSRLKTIFRMLGPGLVTGAADDDPSGIATYSQGGAQFGYALGWTMFLTAPFMIAIQLVSARIGAVTGQGVAANIAKALPRSALYFIVGLLLIANTLNIAADVAAMGDALRLVAGGPMLVYIALFGIGCLAAEILIPYHNYSRYLKALTLVLFAYVATAFSIHIPWGTVAEQTLLPHPQWNRDYTLMLVAIFGTTISPYMFFWQASLEAEGRKLSGKAHDAAAAAALPNRLAEKDAFRIAFDTTTGMVLSNIVGFFIIVTTAATLHAHGITNIGTAEQAAEALRPLAGPLAFLLFSMGIIGTGLLAVPVLAGSAGLCGGGKRRLGRQLGNAGAQRARLLSDRRRDHACRPRRGAHPARSDPDAVLERGRERHRRRAADGRHDDRRCQPHHHGQIRRVALADHCRLVRDGIDGRRSRRAARHQPRRLGLETMFRQCRSMSPTAVHGRRHAAGPDRLPTASRSAARPFA